MDKIPVHTIVNGVNFTSRTYVEMKDRDKAIARMIKDHKHNDHFNDENPLNEQTAGEIFDKMVSDVEKADKKQPVKKEEGVDENTPAVLANTATNTKVSGK